MIEVNEFTVPPAGTDIVAITMEETYDIEGVGQDTVRLSGTLVAERATPLLGSGSEAVDWETSTVVARFTALNLHGESEVFGPVDVFLDPRTPAMAAVTAGKCAAAVSVMVSMPRHELTLHSAEPIQLRSTVRTVPPIGDEQTVSVRSVELVDRRSDRRMGTLTGARVMWRELTDQVRGLPAGQ